MELRCGDFVILMTSSQTALSRLIRRTRSPAGPCACVSCCFWLPRLVSPRFALRALLVEEAPGWEGAEDSRVHDDWRHPAG